MAVLNIVTNIKEDGNNITAKVCGEIDAYTAPKLREAFRPYSDKKHIKIIVDLSEVSYMDSTGLGVFVGLFKSTRANDSSLYLNGLSARLQRLFDITGLADIMEVNKEVEGGV